MGDLKPSMLWRHFLARALQNIRGLIKLLTRNTPEKTSLLSGPMDIAEWFLGKAAVSEEAEKRGRWRSDFCSSSFPPILQATLSYPSKASQAQQSLPETEQLSQGPQISALEWEGVFRCAFFWSSVTSVCADLQATSCMRSLALRKHPSQRTHNLNLHRKLSELMSSHAFISFRAINPEISCVFECDLILNAFIVLQNDSCNIVHAVSIWTVTCIHFNTESPSLGFTSLGVSVWWRRTQHADTGGPRAKGKPFVKLMMFVRQTTKYTDGRLKQSHRWT